MVQPLHNTPEPTARIEGGQLLLDGFVESDPTVVAVLDEADDLEGAVSLLLELGARSQRATAATLDSALVERAFERVMSGFDVSLAGALEQIGKTTSGAVGALEAVFDEDSKSSAQARIEEAIARGGAAHLASLRKALDPGSEDSPLARLKAEILGTLSTQLGLVLTHLTELAGSVAAREAQAATFRLTAVKGASFEELVHQALSEIASRHGDMAEHVGRSGGAAGALTGDEVVHIDPTDTAGHELVIVFEAKNRKLSQRKVFEELGRSAANREATAAVAVFASQEQAPTSVPFTFLGDKAVCVYDPEDGGDSALWLAYMWARLVARRSVEPQADEMLDQAEAEAAIGDACRALGRVTTIKTALSKARNGIEQAGPDVEALRGEIDDALRRLRRALGWG
ncbi:MAG TPA: hypothetical protein VEH29_02720 [Acidimicrobiales bacterium]|nr:hypothetical protein [Acidimicrobiales bacterium]